MPRVCDLSLIMLWTISKSLAQVEESETIVTLTEEMDSIDTGLVEEAASIVKS